MPRGRNRSHHIHTYIRNRVVVLSVCMWCVCILGDNVCAVCSCSGWSPYPARLPRGGVRHFFGRPFHAGEYIYYIHTYINSVNIHSNLTLTYIHTFTSGKCSGQDMRSRGRLRCPGVRRLSYGLESGQSDSPRQVCHSPNICMYVCMYMYTIVIMSVWR